MMFDTILKGTSMLSLILYLMTSNSVLSPLSGGTKWTHFRASQSFWLTTEWKVQSSPAMLRPRLQVGMPDRKAFMSTLPPTSLLSSEPAQRQSGVRSVRAGVASDDEELQRRGARPRHQAPLSRGHWDGPELRVHGAAW